MSHKTRLVDARHEREDGTVVDERGADAFVRQTLRQRVPALELRATIRRPLDP